MLSEASYICMYLEAHQTKRENYEPSCLGLMVYIRIGFQTMHNFCLQVVVMVCTYTFVLCALTSSMNNCYTSYLHVSDLISQS